MMRIALPSRRRLFSFVLSLAVAAATYAAAGCDFGGCNHGNGAGCSDGLGGTGPDMSHPGPAQCATTCPGGCATGETCITPAAITQDHAFCAATCTDDRDCAAGTRCVVLFAAMQPASCILDRLVIGCNVSSGGVCDTPPTCDGDVANEHYADDALGICGWERVHCANGCTAGACNP